MKSKGIIGIFVSALLILLMSCSSDSDKATEPTGDGVQTLTIDASNYEEWVYFSVDNGEVAMPNDPQNSTKWDLAFKRYQIKTNSGTSGSGNGGVIDLGDIDFEDLTEVPMDYYMVDDSISITMHTEKHYSFNKFLATWYNMQGMPPTLTSKGHTYAVRKADGKSYMKLKILNYYDQTSSASGNLTIKYENDLSRSSESFVDSKEVSIDATSDDNWIYYSFDTKDTISIEDPMTSNRWDIAFKRYKIKTNSGVSGSFGNGVAIYDGNEEFDAIKEIKNDIFYTGDIDLVDPHGNSYQGNKVLKDWIDFSQGMPIPHYDRIYIFENRKFNYVKVQMLKYESGNVKFKFGKNVTAKW